jgi:hypothetical protein
MFQQVESDFLENIEMYLFQKKVYRKWKIFKVIAFIPFMLFLSELVEIIFEYFLRILFQIRTLDQKLKKGVSFILS